MSLLTDDHRAWIGTEEPPVTIEVSRRDIQKYAAATEQQQDRYVRGDEAPPMFIFNLFIEIPSLDDLREDGLNTRRVSAFGPELPLKRIMAGGTELRIHQPIRPGDVLTGTRKLTGMTEKQGRSGPLIFIERTLSIVRQDGTAVMDEIQTSIAR